MALAVDKLKQAKARLKQFRGKGFYHGYKTGSDWGAGIAHGAMELANRQKKKPMTDEERLVASAQGPIQDYKPMKGDIFEDNAGPNGGEGAAAPWLTNYMNNQEVSYGPSAQGNVFDTAASAIDKNEAASKVPIGGYHTYKSVEEGAKNGAAVGHDMGVGRTLIRQGGMMNSLPDPENL